MRRSLRILRRVAIVLAILTVLGVGGFTWLAYWPFEGSVDRVEDLVPGDVEFVYRGSWKDMKATGWVQRNVFEHPLHPDFDIRGYHEAELAPLTSQLNDIERQVNESIPGAVKPLMGLLFGTKTFGIEKDLVPGDVVAAGRFCGSATPPGGIPGPRWREILVLARVSSVVKFAAAACKHEFMRGMFIPPQFASDEAPGGFLRIERRDVRPSPAKNRACEGGHEMPPENYWYFARVKDVIAISNSDDLMQKVVDLGNGVGDRAVERPDFRLKPTEGGIAAAVDLLPLRSFLNRMFTAEGAGPGKEASVFVGKFITFNALDRMNATLEPMGPDGLLARAEVTYNARELHPQVRATYELSPEPFATGIARLVPEKDAFVVALLKAQPRTLLQAVYDSLDSGNRKLIEDNVRQIGRFQTVGDFFDELSAQLGTATGVAFSRLSSVFDKVKYETWFANDEPDPKPVMTVLVRIGQGRTRKQVDDFLSDRVLALGFDPPKTVTRNDVTYSRLELKYKVRDLELVKPAYLVTSDTLILTTNEDYLLQIIDTMQGKAGSVADSPRFKTAVSGLPRDATLALYLDAEVLRKYLWDGRNVWVQSERSSDVYAMKYRAERHLYYKSRSTRPGGALSQEDLVKIDEDVDAEADRYRREEYPKFIQEYRGIVDAWKRLRAGALVMAAHQGTIDGGACLLFTPPEPSVSPR